MGLFTWLKTEFGKPTNSPPQTRTAQTTRSPTSTNRAVTKQELLALMAQGLDDVETAIGHHTPEMQALYEQGKRALVAGQATAEVTEWSRRVGLSLQEMAVLDQYLAATAFMSAWYSFHGDKERRNEASAPACMLVSALGFTPEEVLHHYMKFERA